MSASYHYTTRYTAPSPQPRGDGPTRLPSLRDLDFGRRRASSPVPSPVQPPNERLSWTNKPSVPNSWSTPAPPTHQAHYSPPPDVTHPDTHYTSRHSNSYVPSTPSTSSQRSPPPPPSTSMPARQEHPQYSYPPPSRPRQRDARPPSATYTSSYSYSPYASSQPPPPQHASYRSAPPAQAPPPPPPPPQAPSATHHTPSSAHGQESQSVSTHAHSHPYSPAQPPSHAPPSHAPPSSSSSHSNGYHHEQYPHRSEWPAHASPAPQHHYRTSVSSAHGPPPPAAPSAHEAWDRPSAHQHAPAAAPPAAHYSSHASRQHAPPPPPPSHQMRGPPPPPPSLVPASHHPHPSQPPADPRPYAAHPPQGGPVFAAPPAHVSQAHPPSHDHAHAPPHLPPPASHPPAPAGPPAVSSYGGQPPYTTRAASPMTGVQPDPYYRGAEARASPAPSPHDAILRQLIDHCTILYQFATRFSQLQSTLPYMKPGPDELSQMNHRAMEVVRLLGDLRNMSLTDADRAKIDQVAAMPPTEEHRVPKRPWEDMESDGGQDELNGTDSATEDSRTMAEKDMETIRIKRASTTAGAAANTVMPKSKYRKRSRASPPGKCHSCNIRETPEWRRGPDGARTLCNACGLHYAKLMRKRSKMSNGEAPHIDMETLRASARAADISDKFNRPKTASRQAREEKEKEAEALKHHQTSFQVPLSALALPPPPPLTVPGESRGNERVVPPPPSSSSHQGSPPHVRASPAISRMQPPPPPSLQSSWASMTPSPRTSSATRELRYVDSGPPPAYVRSVAK